VERCEKMYQKTQNILSGYSSYPKNLEHWKKMFFLINILCQFEKIKHIALSKPYVFYVVIYILEIKYDSKHNPSNSSSTVINDKEKFNSAWKKKIWCLIIRINKI